MLPWPASMWDYLSETVYVCAMLTNFLSPLVAWVLMSKVIKVTLCSYVVQLHVLLLTVWCCGACFTVDDYFIKIREELQLVSGLWVGGRTLQWSFLLFMYYSQYTMSTRIKVRCPLSVSVKWLGDFFLVIICRHAYIHPCQIYKNNSLVWLIWL